MQPHAPDAPEAGAVITLTAPEQRTLRRLVDLDAAGIADAIASAQTSAVLDGVLAGPARAYAELTHAAESGILSADEAVVGELRAAHASALDEFAEPEAMFAPAGAELDALRGDMQALEAILDRAGRAG